MHNLSKGLRILGAIAAILAIGLAVGWFATRKTDSNVQVESAAPAPSNAPPTARLPFFSTNSKPRPPEVLVNRTMPLPPPPVGTNILADWEDRIEDILGSDGEEAGKARQMLAIFPRLPEEGQVEVAQHLSNLVPDQDYAPLGKFLTDSKLSESVLDVLMVDVLNRPNSLKLPLLLEVARDQQHPKAAEAKDLLELYLEEDYGADWNKWQAKLDQWIKDNPD